MADADLNAVEVVLTRIQNYGDLLEDKEDLLSDCVNSLRQAASSTEQKLAALLRWKGKGLLTGMSAFQPFIKELMVATDPSPLRQVSVVLQRPG